MRIIGPTGCKKVFKKGEVGGGSSQVAIDAQVKSRGHGAGLYG